MAGCDTKTKEPGNYNWSADRITAWALGAGGAGAAWAILEAIAAAAPFGWMVILAAVLAFVAGAGVGFWLGNGVEWFVRLKEQNPKTITVSGMVICAGKNSGVPPFYDNDWTFNLAHSGPPVDLTLLGPNNVPLSIGEVLTRAAPGSGQSQSYFSLDPNNGMRPVFHCEIGSAIGDWAAAGGAVGSVAGAAVGIAAGIAACGVLGIFTFGIGAALCLLIVAALAAAGAWAGGFAGNLVGGGIGWLVDEFSDFDKNGKAITQDCVVSLTGTWVTDKSHQHNEIHDISSSQIIECGDAIKDSTRPQGIVGLVGIGRHPNGPDP
jgi:hypothetical protein